MPNRERKIPIQIYLSEDEDYFLRHLILYGYVYDIDYSELQEYNSALAKIGNNLNQIAKRMNATGNVYEADVKQVKELMQKVWHTQKSMLSRQPLIKQ